MRCAIPAYFRPGVDWERIVDAAPFAGLAVMNVASGPGDELQADYLPVLARAAAAGVRVLGYVDTANARRPLQAVLTDVERYLDWYGVDGLFFDQVHVTPAEVASYYTPLRIRVGARHPDALTVANPGTGVPECFMRIADVLVDFEGPADRYLEATMASWRSGYDPSRFWHIVYGVPEASVVEVAELVTARGTDWAYLTDQGPVSASNGSYLYDRLPMEEMWRQCRHLSVTHL